MTAHDTDGTHELSDIEVASLAKFIVSQRVGWSEDWLQWEDVPYLSEDSFERLVSAVDVIAYEAFNDCDKFSKYAGVNHNSVFDRAVNGDG